MAKLICLKFKKREVWLFVLFSFLLVFFFFRENTLNVLKSFRVLFDCLCYVALFEIIKFTPQRCSGEHLHTEAEPINYVGGASVKTYLRKGKKHCTGRGGEKRMRNNRGSTKVGEEGGASWWSRYYLQHVEDPRRSRWTFPKKMLLRRAHAGAEERCEKKERAERNCYVLTIYLHQ